MSHCCYELYIQLLYKTLNSINNYTKKRVTYFSTVKVNTVNPMATRDTVTPI